MSRINQRSAREIALGHMENQVAIARKESIMGGRPSPYWEVEARILAGLKERRTFTDEEKGFLRLAVAECERAEAEIRYKDGLGGYGVLAIGFMEILREDDARRARARLGVSG